MMTRNRGLSPITRVGVGGQVGAEVEAGLSLQVSNAKTIFDLRGPSNNTAVHGGAGLGGSIDVFTADSANGPVKGLGITGGLAAGAAVSHARVETMVCTFSDGCRR